MILFTTLVPHANIRFYLLGVSNGLMFCAAPWAYPVQIIHATKQ